MELFGFMMWAIAVGPFIIIIIAFAPTLIALTFSRHHTLLIIGINLLPAVIGWPYTCWIIAFAWSIFGPRERKAKLV